MTSEEIKEIYGTEDPVCDICGEKLSKHVPTDSGPYTHPREASGEGRYEFTNRRYYGLDCDDCGGPCDGHDMHRFVPAAKLANPYGHGWSPTS